MPSNDYSFQDDGVVLIGATVLVNVMRARVTWTLEESVSQRIVAGDARAKEVLGPSLVRCTLELEHMDESGITATMNQYQIGASSGKSQTIKLRPRGTGTGKKELILDPPVGQRGMDLTGKPKEYPTGTDAPPATGTMTWIGTFETEVLETLQS